MSEPRVAGFVAHGRRGATAGDECVPASPFIPCRSQRRRCLAAAAAAAVRVRDTVLGREKGDPLVSLSEKLGPPGIVKWVIYSLATKSRRMLSFATSSKGCSVLPLYRAQVLWRGQMAKFGPIPSSGVSERVGPDLTCGTGQLRACTTLHRGRLP
jgi:hypothetical protein